MSQDVIEKKCVVLLEGDGFTLEFPIKTRVFLHTFERGKSRSIFCSEVGRQSTKLA